MSDSEFTPQSPSSSGTDPQPSAMIVSPSSPTPSPSSPSLLIKFGEWLTAMLLLFSLGAAFWYSSALVLSTVQQLILALACAVFAALTVAVNQETLKLDKFKLGPISGTAAGTGAVFVFVCCLFLIGTRNFVIASCVHEQDYMSVLARHWRWQMYPVELKNGSYEVLVHGTWGVMKGQDCGPDGAPSHSTGDETCPLPGAPVGSLIGILVPSTKVDLTLGDPVSTKVTPTFIGHRFQLSIKEPSRMFFLINDGSWPGKANTGSGQELKGYDDNEGALCVRIAPI